MGKVVLRGGATGAAIGVVAGLLIGLAVIGTDDIPDVADREQLPFLYVVAAVIGVVVGLVTGVAGLAVGRGVADASGSSPARRRAYGAVAGGATAGALSLFTTSPLLLTRAPLTFVLVAVVGGLATWFLLPGVVDLDAPSTAPDELPAWGETSPEMEPPSRGRRVLVTVAGAGVGAFVGVQVIMTLVGDVTSLSRSAYDVMAVVVLGLLFLVIGAILWRATGRPREFRGQERLR